MSTPRDNAPNWNATILALIAMITAFFAWQQAKLQAGVQEVHKIVNSNTTKMMSDLEAVRAQVTKLTGEKATLTERVKEEKP